MPQMAPMWWTSLMLMFSTSLLIMMTIVYFNFKIEIKKKNNLSMKKIKWMW